MCIRDSSNPNRMVQRILRTLNSGRAMQDPPYDKTMNELRGFLARLVTEDKLEKPRWGVRHQEQMNLLAVTAWLFRRKRGVKSVSAMMNWQPSGVLRFRQSGTTLES